jgi:hypothetical protein
MNFTKDNQAMHELGKKYQSVTAFNTEKFSPLSGRGGITVLGNDMPHRNNGLSNSCAPMISIKILTGPYQR